MSPGPVETNVIVRSIIAGRNHAFRSEYFAALVVSINRPSAIVDRSDRAVFKSQRHHRRVPIAHRAYHGVHQHICLRVDLDDFAAYEKTRHIEIMDGHVQENATGGAQVFFWRWRRIAARNSQDLGVSDATGLDNVPQLGEIRIEAAIE